MKFFAALVLATSLMTGCVALIAGGAGAGAVAFAKGEYETSYQRPYDQTWQATQDALKDLGIKTYNTSKDGGLIEATKNDGTAVRVVLQSTDPKTTAIKIRVGKVGDEQYSRTIDNKIRERLGIK